MQKKTVFKKTSDGFVVIPRNAEGTSPLTQTGAGSHVVKFVVYEDGKFKKKANDTVVSYNYVNKLLKEPNVLYIEFDGKVVKDELKKIKAA